MARPCDRRLKIVCLVVILFLISGVASYKTSFKPLSFPTFDTSSVGTTFAISPYKFIINIWGWFGFFRIMLIRFLIGFDYFIYNFIWYFKVAMIFFITFGGKFFT